MVNEVERATGGKVEIGSFRFDWKTMTAEVQPFVLRGTEPPGSAPFFRADSVQVGLKIISALKRDIDLQFAIIEKPSINILVRPDGSTNIPSPQRQRRERVNPLELFVKLAIQKFEMRNGNMSYADKRLPLDVRGENLKLQLSYDFVNPRYVGDLSMNRLNVTPGPLGELPFDFASHLAVEPNRVVFERVSLAMGSTTFEARGTLTDIRNPILLFDVSGDMSIADLVKPLRLPVEPAGRVAMAGKLQLGRGVPFNLEGLVRGSRLAVRVAGMHIAGISMNSRMHLNTDHLELPGLEVRLLGGTFLGDARIREFETYRVSGIVRGVSLQELSRYPGVKTVAWNGAASGSVNVSGSFRQPERNLAIDANLDIEPAEGPHPLQGKVELAYDGRSQKLKLGRSYIATSNSRIQFSGTFGEILNVSVQSRDLNDLLPAVAMFTDKPPPKIPVVLRKGLATFEGAVEGPIASPQITGRATATNFEVQGRIFDSFAANGSISATGAQVTDIALLQGPLRVDGQARIELTNWRPVEKGPVSGRFTIENAQLSRLLTEAKVQAPVEGTLSGSVEISGTFAAPDVVASLTVDKLAAYGERFNRLRANLKYSGGSVEVLSGLLESGPARVRVAGAYKHAPRDWTTGDLRFTVTGENLTLSEFERLKQYGREFQGQVALDVQGTARLQARSFRLTSANGKAAIRDLAVDRRSIGDAIVSAKTSGDVLRVDAGVDFRGTKITAESDIQLAGNYPAKGEIRISRLSFVTLDDFRAPGKLAEQLPFDGFLEGNVTFSGQLANLDALRGRIEIANIEVRPNTRERLGVEDRLNALTLRNSGPVIIDVDGKGLHVQSATLVAKDTSVTAAGDFSFASKTPWDLRVKGFINLAILETFNPDFLASGVSTVNGTIRGSLEQPLVSGTLELKNAAFSVPDFPNGLDQANGTILFDRNRATIQELKAQTGGGDLSLSGFVGFGGPEMIYRLQATATRVRVRYPEGVSTTLNANLNFTGTSTNSLLAGGVTIMRVGFTPRTDLGGLLAESAKPVTTPRIPSPFLRGIQFDIRLETAPNVQFQTSLTRDIQAETDLRVRGTVASPVVLGRVSITHGEIQFFGNRYTINRGEIGFFNPVKIEPVLDMDLETRVRGIDVTINFSGSINKLNVTYRSDPPLQSQEIIALLAAGRAPAGTPVEGVGQTPQSASFLQTGANTLLGQAVASPISGRLQRFFGVSRLKIDPQLTGMGNTPQARLTVEQQISRDITLTYATNLTRTNHQLVQIQWDINRTWSVIALREENGIFGLDFQYRKQFK
jgi:translocation and assembly module TamB